MRVVEAGSTMYPCLFVLRKRGYTISCSGDGIVATKGDDEFYAESAPALLGLVCMAEARGGDWSSWSAEESLAATENRVIDEG